MLFSEKNYHLLNKKLIVKAIEELSFEEVFGPVEEKKGHYKLELGHHVVYRFKAELGAWGELQVSGETLKKEIHGKECDSLTLASFFKEAQVLCDVSDEVLAPYIEEAHQTLYTLLNQNDRLEEIQLEKLVHDDFKTIDQLLMGHPKLIMSHGRIGFSIEDMAQFAPEQQPRFKLRWLAVHKDVIESDDCPLEILHKLANESLGSEQLEEIKRLIPGILFQDYELVPVHPWQWKRYILVQFYEYLNNSLMIDLGERGHFYTPQSSLRTLSREGESFFDIKVPLSILNTSCIRGLPGRYIKSSAQISQKMSEIVEGDSFLRLDVLKEVHACRVKHPDYEDIENSSYRFKEMLGHVWRESVQSKLDAHEKALPCAALLFQKGSYSFVSDLINFSGLTPNDWIKRYFQHVFIPLYHLQVVHGVGLVAHGQNTILVHSHGVPERLIIKDFHGDLRLSTISQHRNDPLFSSLQKLRPDHLIHDLFTGHGVGVLRYLSRVLKEFTSLNESTFYRILHDEIHEYHRQVQRPADELNLLRPRFERVLVNKVRFHVGYDENARPLPMLGGPIYNPISRQGVP